MLQIKSICEVEVLKRKINIKDNLVKLNCGHILNEISKYNYEMDYVSIYLNSIENLDVEKVIAFFNNALKNDIIKTKYWVSYLDTHMENRYVEDNEMLIEYRPDIENVPLAIRGDKDSVMIFIDNILKTLHLEDNEIIEVLNNINYDNTSLPNEEFENYEFVEEEYEDRAYYEQRPRRYTI